MSSRFTLGRSDSRFGVALAGLVCLALTACTGSAASPSPSSSGGVALGSPTAGPTDILLGDQTSAPSTGTESTVIPSNAPGVSVNPSASPTPAHTATPAPRDTASLPPNPCGGDIGMTTSALIGNSLPSALAPVADIAPGHFGPTGLPLARGGYDAAAHLGNGQVLFLGGGTYGDRAEIYVPSGPASGSFVPTGSLLLGRRDPLVATLPNGRVLVVGGGPAFGCVSIWISEVEVYVPAAGTNGGHFISLNTSNPGTSDHAVSPLHGTDYTALTRLADGRILLSGGQSCDDSGTICQPVSEIYDSSVGSAGTFTPTKAAIPFSGGSTATALSNGLVLFAGGQIETDSGVVASDAAGLYDPANDTFTPTGHLSTARANAAAVLLSGGGVLISGGSDRSNIVASAEIYDPAGGTFHASAQPMTTARSGQSAIALADGRHVLIVGGLHTSGSDGGAMTWLASAELYDSSSGTFSTTGSMSVLRPSFTATLLSGGAVLVVGSPDQAGSADSADLYIP